MRLCAGQSGAKLTLLLRFGATGGAANTQGLFLFGFHDYTNAGLPNNKMVDCDQSFP